MPSFDPHQYHGHDDVDDDFSVFAPGAINNADYVENDDVDLLIPSQSNHQRDRSHRRRRDRGYMFSWCLDAQSDSSSASSTIGAADGTELLPRKSCNGHRILGRILANVFVSIAVILLTLGLAGGLLYYSIFQLEPKPTIDKSVTSFQIPNHNATRRQDALEEARKELKDLQKTGRPRVARDTYELGGTFDDVYDDIYRYFPEEPHTRHRRQALPTVNLYPQAYRYWKMQVVYLAESNDASDPDAHNIFTEQRLSQIRDIEMSIMGHDNFMNFCYKNYARIQEDPNLSMFGGCAPLNSLLTYFYPSIDPTGRVHYDGLGSKLEDIDKTLKFAMTRETFYWYVDDKLNTTYRKSRLLRTELQFGAPLPGMFRFIE